MANYDWDSIIEKDGAGEFLVLPEGEYSFTVSKFERGVVGGTGKYAGCKMAKLTLSCKGEEGTANVFYNIILNDAFERRLSSFFVAIGMKKRGEQLAMKWGDVEGKSGRCKLIITKDNHDNDRNEVKYMLEPVAQPDAGTEEAVDDLPF